MSANRNTVRLADGREILLSYDVPVAAFIPADFPERRQDDPAGYIRIDRRYSVTTLKHANGYAGKDSPRVAPAVFARLVSPFAVK